MQPVSGVSFKGYPLILVASMVAAGAFAAFHHDAPEPEPRPSVVKRSHEPPESDEEPSAPPLHPQGTSPQGTLPHESSPAPSIAVNHEEDAVGWKVPEKWRTVPNPSTMRIATYRVPAAPGAEEAEMSVARAGGSVDDNIERWVGQFQEAAKETRAVKKVHGVKVTIVELGGTYLGGGAMGGAPVSHTGWSLLAAIVESAGSPYFFKLTGPAATVRAARPAFDALVESVAPSTKPL